jgi:uncharacterized damage-inducible protein DinB
MSATRTIVRHASCLAAACLLAGAPLAAQAPAAAQPAGWRAEFLFHYDQAAEKYVQLAEATPAEKFTWRPAEGVRSIAEVYLHISQANYGFTRNLGGAPPAGLNMQGFEKSTTDKAAVVKHLRDSFAAFRAAVTAFPEGEPERMVRFFSPAQITARQFLFFTADHTGEHLGQAIAYARMNGIVPPWSN